MSPSNKHCAIGKQGGSVSIAFAVKSARGTPAPRDRIVQFRARENAAAIKTSCHKHLAIRDEAVDWRPIRLA